MTISQQIISLLGGACQQTVSRSMDPVGWLKTRIRQVMFPHGQEGPVPRSLFEQAKREANQFAIRAKKRLEALPEAKTGGRPAKRNPEALAELLEVDFTEGDTLVSVFIKFVKNMLAQVNPLLNGIGSFVRLWKILDEQWAPLWLHSEPVYPIEVDVLDEMFGSA